MIPATRCRTETPWDGFDIFLRRTGFSRNDSPRWSGIKPTADRPGARKTKYRQIQVEPATLGFDSG